MLKTTDISYQPRELKVKAVLLIFLISILGVMFSNPMRPQLEIDTSIRPVGPPAQLSFQDVGASLFFCNINESRIDQTGSAADDG